MAEEKRALLEKLTAAGGDDFAPLIGISRDLSDIIDEISEISGKRAEKMHAALESKLKYSGKVRRKAKELGRFEQNIIREYDSKRISLGHGRKMAAVIKLLRSNNVDKARREAEEFYSLLEMDGRLRIVEEELSKAGAQVERAKRGTAERLSGLEWLSAQIAPDEEKIARHAEGERLRESLGEARLECIRSLQSMPLPELLARVREQNLQSMGFPAMGGHGEKALCEFLRKCRWEAKNAAQLEEIAGQSEQKLRHLGIDLAAFRQEIAGNKRFFGQVMALQTGDFLDLGSEKSIEFLSQMDEGAKNAAERLKELGKTADGDRKEWERKGMVEGKRRELEGADAAGLAEEMRGLEELEKIIAGKIDAVTPKQEEKKKAGLLDSLRETLRFLK